MFCIVILILSNQFLVLRLNVFHGHEYSIVGEIFNFIMLVSVQDMLDTSESFGTNIGSWLFVR